LRVPKKDYLFGPKLLEIWGSHQLVEKIFATRPRAPYVRVLEKIGNRETPFKTLRRGLTPLEEQQYKGKFAF